LEAAQDTARDDVPLLEVRNLYKAFGANQVLRGVNLRCDRGTTTVILGQSGTGKSVLLKHLIGLLAPDSGEVIVGGQTVHLLGRRALRQLRTQFGVVFQSAALFDSLSVAENVEFPLREHLRALPESEIRKKAQAKLAQLGLQDAADRYPSEISGGMRKRVGLARAVILDPNIVLYDEPTTGLDPITAESVNAMVQEAAVKLRVTSLVISHDVASAFRIADRIAVLHEGEIVAQGTPKEVKRSHHDFVVRFLAAGS
jgi:phospholipid/cholesterol/gamma-HCH transport system ATP-binding protein